MYPREKVNKPFEGRMKPFKIIGNVYFVGTYQASSHLIDPSCTSGCPLSPARRSAWVKTWAAS